MKSKKEFDELAGEILKKFSTDRKIKNIILRIWSDESAIRFGRLNLIDDFVKLGIDTREELLAIKSIDELLERYSCFLDN